MLTSPPMPPPMYPPIYGPALTRLHRHERNVIENNDIVFDV